MSRRLPYMTEPWFDLLRSACQAHGVSGVAQILGVSRPAVSMVLNGCGPYGRGQASTQQFGRRVQQFFDGTFECPFLTQFTGEPRRITGTQCRDYAYREPPTTNPHEGRHWRACRTCPQRVIAPSHWDEARGHFIDASARLRPRRARTADAVAAAPAADNSTEKEAA